jgi:transposase InsO family protein
VQQFDSIADARRKIEAWRSDYNELRSHGPLGDVAPGVAKQAWAMWQVRAS